MDMTKKQILFILTIPFVIIGLQSYKKGPTNNVGNRTGSNGLTTGCSSCHGNKNAATQVTIELLENGNPVTKYTPEMTYDVRLTAFNTNSRPAYGFQLACGSATPSSSLFGLFDNTNVDNTSLKLSRKLLEHSTTLDGEIIDGKSQFTRTFKWTAPPKGTGDLAFYAAVNAVNDNGKDDSGDQWSLGKSNILAESSGTASISDVNRPKVGIFPNPAADEIQIDISTLPKADYRITLIDMSGNEVASIVIKTGVYNKNIDVRTLPSGHYTFLIKGNGTTTTTHLVKI